MKRRARAEGNFDARMDGGDQRRRSAPSSRAATSVWDVMRITWSFRHTRDRTVRTAGRPCAAAKRRRLSREVARLLTILLIPIACSSTTVPTPVDPAWGPLAVAPAPVDTLQALATGVIDIGGSCVTLRHGDDESLLVWPVEQTTWDPVNHAIQFTNRPGDTVVIIDGQLVRIGGGGALGNRQPDEWLASVQWIARPAPNCPLAFPWSVNEVTLSV